MGDWQMEALGYCELDTVLRVDRVILNMTLSEIALKINLKAISCYQLICCKKD